MSLQETQHPATYRVEVVTADLTEEQGATFGGGEHREMMNRLVCGEWREETGGGGEE